MKIQLPTLFLALKKQNITSISTLFHNVSFQMGLEIFSTKKINNLFTSSNNLFFLNNVFQIISQLKPKNHLELLKYYTDFYEIETYQHIPLQEKNISSIIEKNLQTFVINSLDLFLFKQSHKKYNIKELQFLYKIGQQFHVPDLKIIKWISKAVIASNHIHFLEKSFSLQLLQDKTIQKKYINHLMNEIQNIKLLDSLFSLKEKEIYDIYAELKINKKIWSCLSIQKNKNSSDIYSFYLPYISLSKLDWFEQKKIGYINSNNYFELFILKRFHNSHQLNSFIINSDKKDYYQNLIYNAIQQYEKEIIPIKEKYFSQFKNTYSSLQLFESSQEYQNFLLWVQESPTRQCLFLLDNKLFYEDCKKIYFNTFLNYELTNNSTLSKKNKI